MPPPVAGQGITSAAADEKRRRRLSVLGEEGAVAQSDSLIRQSAGAGTAQAPHPGNLLPTRASSLAVSFELTVSPGFDPEQQPHESPKECQDEGIVVRSFLDNPAACLVAVFDGHGVNGRKCAKLSAAELPKLMAARAAYAFTQPERALRESAEALSDMLLNNNAFSANYSGTTACIVLLLHSVLHVAHVGDSRAVLVKAPQAPGWPVRAVDITIDHKPDMPEERARIERAGGWVGQQQYDGEFDGPQRVFCAGTSHPGLAMSRSLGDGVAKSVGVVATPTYRTVALSAEDLYLVVASDGLWEVFSSAEAAAWIAAYDARPGALHRMPVTQAIAEEAQRRWVRMDAGQCVVDDTTVVIARLA